MTKINIVESVFEDFAVLVKIKNSLYLFTDPTAAVISDDVTESVVTINGRETIKLRFEWQVCLLNIFGYR